MAVNLFDDLTMDAQQHCSRSPGSRMAAALALVGFVAVISLSLVPASVSASPESPYLRSLARLDGALRFAIERQPEGLAKSLAASERVCSLAQGAEERTDPVASAADWSTLSEAVALLDEPGLAAVELSFREASATLGQLESTFSRAWRGQSSRLRALHRGATALRGGLRHLGDSFAHLREAFAGWREHRCEAALASINDFDQAIPDGIAGVSRGMWRLRVVSEPAH